MNKPLIDIVFPPDKPGRGGSRKGAGRKPKGEEKRIQKSVNLPPSIWAIIAAEQAMNGGSESDAIERLLSNR